jgi:hypothetical protein
MDKSASRQIIQDIKGKDPELAEYLEEKCSITEIDLDELQYEHEEGKYDGQT